MPKAISILAIVAIALAGWLLAQPSGDSLIEGFRMVEVASVAQNLGNMLKASANDVIDLAGLFRTFEMIKVQEAAAPTTRSPAQLPAGGDRRRPRFRLRSPRNGPSQT